MTARTVALVMLLSCLTLIGATAADWAVAETERTIDTDQVEVVIDQQDRVSGAEVAGGLYAVGLAGILIAALTLRWPVVGALQIPVGGLAASGWWSAIRELEGATSAPWVVLVTAILLTATGGAAILIAIRRRRSGAGAASRVRPPSRYTVEAAQGRTEDPDDEWDIAVADQTDEDDDREADR